MFTLDERLKGLPATREQIVSLFQSINSPHLAVPGKQAGPAQAFIVGLRGGSGFAVFIYLSLAESADCAVYAPARRNLSPEEYQDEENEAQPSREAQAGHASAESAGNGFYDREHPGIRTDGGSVSNWKRTEHKIAKRLGGP